MTPQQKLEFEQQINVDADLAEQTRLYMIAQAEIQHGGREVLKSYAKKVYETAREEGGRTLMFRPVVWTSVAAAVILLILFFVFFPRASQEMSPDALFAQYYTPHSAIEARNLDASENVLRKGLDNYYEKNYGEAIAALSLAIDSLDGANLLIATFFLGQSYIETGETEAALESFSKVSEGSLYGYVARWNIALAYVKLNRVEDARKQLTEIRNNPNYQFYHDKADELLDILGTK